MAFASPQSLSVKLLFSSTEDAVSTKQIGDAKAYKSYRPKFSLFKSQFEGILRPNHTPLSIDSLN